MQSGGNDTELVSRTLQLEQKLYYLDLKDNNRGRFLKISERTNTSRSTIIVPLAGVVWFVDLFNYYANGDDAELSSKELQLDTKVFYFDVGENARGRYLKVSEAQVPRSSYNRSNIIVPAGSNRDEGWAAFRNVLVEIHEASLSLPPHPAHASQVPMPGPVTTFLPPDAAAVGAAPAAGMAPLNAAPVGVGPAGAPLPSAAAAPVPAASAAAAVAAGAVAGTGGSGGGGGGGGAGSSASRVIRAEQKRFFLDLGSNARGHFLRISEVLGGERSSIILPASGLEELHDHLGQFIGLLRKQGHLQPNLSTTGPQVRNLPPSVKPAGDGDAINS